MTDDTTTLLDIDGRLLLALASVLSTLSLALNFVVIQEIDTLSGAAAALSANDIQLEARHSQLIDTLGAYRTELTGIARR